MCNYKSGPCGESTDTFENYFMPIGKKIFLVIADWHVQPCKAVCSKDFVKGFQKVPQAVGLYCILP